MPIEPRAGHPEEQFNIVLRMCSLLTKEQLQYHIRDKPEGHHECGIFIIRQPEFCMEKPTLKLFHFFVKIFQLLFDFTVSVLTASLFVCALGALRTVHSVNLSVNKLRRILLNHMLSSINPPSLYYAKNMRCF